MDERQHVSGIYNALGVRLPDLDVIIDGGPRPIVGFEVPAIEAIETWEKLRKLTERSGYYPLVTTEIDSTMFELEADSYSIEDALVEAKRTDAAKWLKRRAELDEDLYTAVEQGEWSDEAEMMDFTVPFDITSGEPLEDVRIALIPTTRPWEVPAYMGFGGWNECPNPEHHVAMMKHWHDRYGAEIVTMSRDIIEMRVERPPATEEAAAELAYEQFVYTGGDLVYQGTQTLLALASSLKDGPVWFFWWD